MEQIALIMNNTLSRLAADTLFCCETDNSKSRQSVTIRKLYFFKWVFTTQPTVFGASKYESHPQGLIYTFENDNKHFKRL